MKFDIVTIFPRMVEASLGEGIVGRAIQRGLLDLKVHDLRDYTADRHRTVDDVPFGGGAGMVMKPEPLFQAVRTIRERRGAPGAVILTSPDGRLFTHREAERLSQLDHVVVLCGRYEGVDGRVRDHLATEALSIGDFVVSGGELPALIIVDAVARLVPGVVGDESNVAADSFASGLIYGFLTGRGAAWAVECGAAHGALAMTTPGDTTMATLAEVEKVMAGAAVRVER